MGARGLQDRSPPVVGTGAGVVLRPQVLRPAVLAGIRQDAGRAAPDPARRARGDHAAPERTDAARAGAPARRPRHRHPAGPDHRRLAGPAELAVRPLRAPGGLPRLDDQRGRLLAGPKLGTNRAHARARLPTSSSGPWVARRSGQAIPRNPARHCATVSYAGFFQTSPTAEVAAADARGTQVLSTEAVLCPTPAEAAQAL